MGDTPRTYRRQEQEPAGDEITEVAPGVLRMQLPVALPGLGHVNCYLLEDERGVALVDPGLPGPRAWKALEHKLRLAGVPLKRVHTVVVTHSHPDHYGGAGRLRKEVAAEIVGHHSFRVWWDPQEPPDVDLETDAEARSTESPFRKVTPWGGHGYAMPWRRRMLFSGMKWFPGLVGTPAPSRRLRDADTVRLARRDWIAIHTPGHTPDHLCLLDPAEGVLLSGDHVLPTITPHISGLTTATDPLAQFFASLDRMSDLAGVRTVLPAHGHPFADLTGRARAIKHHHEERLDVLRRASAELGRPATVMELSQHLFSPRAEGPMADSETYAHLEHLRLAGEAEVRRHGELLEYVVG